MVDLENVVRDSLGDFLRSVGRSVPPMDASTRPLADLGLETDQEVEWLCDLEELGFDIPHAFRAFVTEDGSRMRNIKEIAESLKSYQTDKVKAGRHG